MDVGNLDFRMLWGGLQDEFIVFIIYRGGFLVCIYGLPSFCIILQA